MFFSEHRKEGLTLWITSQHPKRIDKILRELTHYYIWSSNVMNRLFIYRYYTNIFDCVNGSKEVKTSFIIPSRKIYNQYNTNQKLYNLSVKSYKEYKD